MIDHRGAVNTIVDINRRFGIGPADRVLAVSALNFDLSVYDIFGLLAAGGAIVMPDAERRLDPAHWLDLMTRHGVTVWNTVPALLQVLTDHLDRRAEPAADGPLRTVMLSGDWIPLPLPDRIRAWNPRASVHSLGGATEASIWSIHYPIGDVKADWPSIPYGKPLVNQTFHVLDGQLNPRADWVPGHLYIGGLGLALGYWKDPEKTAASFIVHPRTGERLYRTGDLGRYLPDGNIEFLGREDFQVKVRGHRIELGEIEAALRQHAGIRDVVVTVVGDTPEAREIVAYVIPRDGEERGTSPAMHGVMSREDLERFHIPLVDVEERIEFKLRRDRPAPAAGPAVPLATDGRTSDAERDAAYLSRQSYRRFTTGAIPFDAFGGLLETLGPMTIDGAPFPKYRYPSADSLYPVQAWLFVKPDRVDGLPGGFYWFDAAGRRLVRVSDETEVAHELWSGEYIVPVVTQAAFALFFIADLSRIVPMCGDLSRDFCLLEAGCMLQLLMSEAPARELGLCPISVVNEPNLRRLLRLGGDHALLHSVVGGGIEPSQRTRWGHEAASAAPGDGPASETLRQYLQAQLPHYMVPSHFVPLETFPLTGNGKVDRKALPAPKAAAGETFVAPSGEIERTVGGLVERLLGRARVGATANFFELGANSLQLVQLAGELSQAMQRHVSIVDVFRYPTIRTLVAHLNVPQPSGAGSAQQGQQRGAARRNARRGPSVER